MDHEKIYKELLSVGITCYRIELGAPVTNGDKTLVGLVVSAHGKTVTDPEVIALRDYLNADSRWDAYVACRKADIQQARQARYREETDSLRLKADEDYTIGSEDWLAAIEAWKTAKNTIRAGLPYEVE